MLGVVNAEAGLARLWTGKIRPSYPHLLGPGLKLVHGLGVENSAYVIVIDLRRRIVEHWPGISREMLARLSSRLATLTNSPEPRLEFDEAPDTLYSGCPFDLN